MDDDDEARMREFERLFMRDVNQISDEEIKMLEEIILPHLIIGGEAGSIKNVKAMRIGEQPDNDLSWLDKYL